MQDAQLEILSSIQRSLMSNQQVTLVTVIKTWGASPRPAGALMAIDTAGNITGSVSGGCIEEDLIERLKHHPVLHVERVVYGKTEQERQALKLPCGGTMELLLEPCNDLAMIDGLIKTISNRNVIQRRVNLQTGHVSLGVFDNDSNNLVSDDIWQTIWGPTHQLIIIGAGQTSEYLASMATLLNFSIHVCDPRPEYFQQWTVANTQLHTQYPDDAIANIGLDKRTAVVALTHDPKLDDLALLAALDSEAFYVGALGSQTTNKNRRDRLNEHFHIPTEQLAKLHGPVGLFIGSKTPPEIALSVLAEIIAEKNKSA